MNKKLVLVAASLAVSQAWAVNKCIGNDGTVSFQEAACSADGQKLREKRPAPVTEQKSVMSPEATARALDAQLVDAQKKRAERDKATGGTNWAAVRDSLDERDIKSLRAGMSADEARRVMGQPARITTTTTAGGQTQQWVYPEGRARNHYVYLRNDIVTAIQAAE